MQNDLQIFKKKRFDTPDPVLDPVLIKK